VQERSARVGADGELDTSVQGTGGGDVLCLEGVTCETMLFCAVCLERYGVDVEDGIKWSR